MDEKVLTDGGFAAGQHVGSFRGSQTRVIGLSRRRGNLRNGIFACSSCSNAMARVAEIPKILIESLYM